MCRSSSTTLCMLPSMTMLLLWLGSRAEDVTEDCGRHRVRNDGGQCVDAVVGDAKQISNVFAKANTTCASSGVCTFLKSIRKDKGRVCDWYSQNCQTTCKSVVDDLCAEDLDMGKTMLDALPIAGAVIGCMILTAVGCLLKKKVCPDFKMPGQGSWGGTGEYGESGGARSGPSHGRIV